ncbi:UNVERIFIED_CONTAM: hypothetical protein GTU68_031984, partial [Idotea baltica]|nr:hypothetical protein [Idotea baltica]
MEPWVIYVIIAGLVGLIIGYILSHLKGKSHVDHLATRNKELQLHVDQQQQAIHNQQAAHQVEVSAHIGQIAQLHTQTAVYQQKIEHQKQLYDQLIVEFNQERDLLRRAHNDSDQLSSQLAVARNKVTGLEEKLREYKSDVQSMEQRFEQLATKIFTEKTDILKRESSANIQGLLNPLKEKINHFEQRVNVVHSESQKQQGQLKEQLLHLQQLNQQVSQEANNLTKALKGDKKIQGNWGEMVLDNILRKSGLEEGREYEKQVHLVDERGLRHMPDVVINLPDQKKMIIDSKVSLVAYEKLINADTEENERLASSAHVTAIRNHIKSLSEKSYHDLIQSSPDFVLMFIPIETAFNIVTKEYPKLYNEAFDKNIVIVTPSTLLVSLKTIESLWQNDKQQKYALDIAHEAGKMYDKFHGLLNDLKKLGRQMDTTTKTYQDSMNKL